MSAAADAPARAGAAALDEPPPSGQDSGIVVGAAFARLYGEPLFNLPQDLYIPPEALEIFLDAFEGPLDLLLYLIRKQNFNVLDIPMAEVTRQYLGYVDQVRHSKLELAAEYLLMAAVLIEIKSRMLLPPRRSDPDDEGEDPRAELVRRLLEYEQMKLAARQLDSLPLAARDFFIAHAVVGESENTRLPEVRVADLQSAWLAILKRAKLVKPHRITREELSVREHMSGILRSLHKSRFVEFADLFDPVRGVPVVIVHFLALLELAREALVQITQAEAYAPIYIRLNQGAAAARAEERPANPSNAASA